MSSLGVEKLVSCSTSVLKVDFSFFLGFLSTLFFMGIVLLSSVWGCWDLESVGSKPDSSKASGSLESAVLHIVDAVTERGIVIAESICSTDNLASNELKDVDVAVERLHGIVIVHFFSDEDIRRPQHRRTVLRILDLVSSPFESACRVGWL
ncbi:unnamed protein product [Owenia fusiformis]|uniref:Uncharacterized protein n=1 Tax=Owenia fusiformis TaxID=6347 RepID=A0A8S4MYV1_OWEFU|nr:unnamed protein product [Owenia fusiformis]